METRKYKQLHRECQCPFRGPGGKAKQGSGREGTRGKKRLNHKALLLLLLWMRTWPEGTLGSKREHQSRRPRRKRA
jgi:hypothetical protein